MASIKKLGCVMAVLLVAWVLYVYHQVPHSPSPFTKAVDHADGVLLEQGSKKVELRKHGTQWNVGTGSGSMYKAEEGTLKTLLSGLKDVQIDDEISDRADRAAEFEVNLESGTHVTLFDAKNSRLAEGVFGKQAPDMSHIYFRYPDKPTVYLARGIIKGELGGMDLKTWRNRDLITIPETKFQSMTIERNGHISDFIRVSTEAWTLNGKPIEAAPVHAMIGTLAHLRADDFLDPAVSSLTYGSLTSARITVRGPETSVELHVGPEDIPSKRYPVSLGPEQGVAWVSEAAIHSLLQNPAISKSKP